LSVQFRDQIVYQVQMQYASYTCLRVEQKKAWSAIGQLCQYLNVQSLRKLVPFKVRSIPFLWLPNLIANLLVIQTLCTVKWRNLLSVKVHIHFALLYKMKTYQHWKIELINKLHAIYQETSNYINIWYVLYL
jgi:hypothetical protein